MPGCFAPGTVPGRGLGRCEDVRAGAGWERSGPWALDGAEVVATSGRRREASAFVCVAREKARLLSAAGSVARRQAMGRASFVRNSERGNRCFEWGGW